MDSVNFSEKTELSKTIYKNAAINTESFFACAFCGSRNYLQTFPQTNSFPACNSDFSRLGPCEKEYSSHEPIFSSPPLFQPLFQNKFVPPNVFYSHMNVPSSINADFSNSQLDGKVCKQPSQFFMMYHPSKNTVDTRSNIEGKNDESVESGSKEGFENRMSCAPVCSCNNMIPWTCSPCIVPMVSYFVSWGHPYTSRQIAKSNLSNEDEESTKNEKNCKFLKPSNASATAIQVEEKRICSSRISEKLKKMEWKKTCEFKESSTSFVSMASLENVEEELSFSERRSQEKETKTSINSKANYTVRRNFSDQVEEELEESNEAEDKISSVLQLNSNENQIYYSGSIQDNLRNHSAAESSISSTDANSDAESCIFETVIPKEQNDGNNHTQSSESLIEKGSKTKDRNVKKLITNFTLSDECKTEIEEDSNECEGSRIAAAGDVPLNSESELKVSSENQSVPSELNDSNSRKNLLGDLEAGERLSISVKDPNKKKQTKKYQANGRFNDVTTRKKNVAPSLGTTQEDSSSKKSRINERRKQIYPTIRTTTNADSSSQVQESKTRTTVQSKGPKNLKLKVENSCRENLTKKKDFTKNLNFGQNVALEKNSVKLQSRSIK